MRGDLSKIIELAKEMGFSQIQLATNGICLAKSTEYCKRLKDAGLTTIYLSFFKPAEILVFYQTFSLNTIKISYILNK